MRTALPLVVTTVALAVGGCSSSDSGQAGSSNSSDRAYHNHSTHEHHDETGDVEAKHGEQHTPDSGFAATLVAPADLPAGYIVGAHHEQPATAPARNPAACEPLADLLAQTHSGTHQGHNSVHPQVVTVLSKSHFGPQIMEHVIDYGSDAAAESGLDELRGVLERCSRYTHSASAIGANTYRVQPGPKTGTGNPGGAVSLRLTSVGPDFDEDATINWDVWSTRIGSRLLSVAFRSAPGGDNADLLAVVRAALDKQQANP